MDQPLTIGRVAGLAGVGTETIRFYEREGLIKAPPRNHSGYRVYGPEVVGRLHFIKKARELGFSLPEVRMLLRGDHQSPETCREVKDLLLAKARELDDRLLRLQAARAALDRLIDGCPVPGGCSICTLDATGLPEPPGDP